MVKRASFLIYSLLILHLTFLQSGQEDIVLPKRIMRELINKYQINEEIAYLAQLLSLPRLVIKNKFIKYLKKYNNLQQSNACKSHYSTDLKETERKAQQLTTVLKLANQSLTKNSEPSIVLQKSLNIQNKLINNYKILINNEQIVHLIDKDNNLKKMSFILEALYFTAIDTKDLKENQKWYKLLSKKFHPDKTHHLDEKTQEEATNLFKTFQPLLNDNKSNNHLNDMIKAIREKRNESIEQINNPSLKNMVYKYITEFNCQTTLPIIGEGIGVALCNKTFAKLMPSSARENEYRDACVASARNSALQIETKLIKHS